MFYNEEGKHVRTKKEITDPNETIREGCKVVPKGEVYEKSLFSIKDKRFKRDEFLDEVKVQFTEEDVADKSKVIIVQMRATMSL